MPYFSQNYWLQLQSFGVQLPTTKAPTACPGSPFGRGTVHAGPGPVPDGVPLPLRQGEQHIEHETGGGAVVAGVQPLRQRADVDALP